nr:T3SS effector HopA1 family protein [Streptomyces harenosi]
MDVRVWVPDELVTDRSGDATATVLLPSGFPALSPGFLVTQGTRPLPPGNPASLRRLYLSLRAAADAPAVWATVLGALEETGVPYRAKAASVAWFYPRTDAVTVYVDARHLERASAALLPRLRRQEGLEPATSLLCERLAPGIAVASEPDDPRPGRRGLSFGEHRCSLLAHALVDARMRGAAWREVLPPVLEAANVDPDEPWRNLTGRTEPQEASPPPHEPAGPVPVRS